jgi:hypothetical protein
MPTFHRGMAPVAQGLGSAISSGSAHAYEAAHKLSKPLAGAVGRAADVTVHPVSRNLRSFARGTTANPTAKTTYQEMSLEDAMKELNG